MAKKASELLLPSSPKFKDGLKGVQVNLSKSHYAHQILTLANCIANADTKTHIIALVTETDHDEAGTT